MLIVGEATYENAGKLLDLLTYTICQFYNFGVLSLPDQKTSIPYSLRDRYFSSVTTSKLWCGLRCDRHFFSHYRFGNTYMTSLCFCYFLFSLFCLIVSMLLNPKAVNKIIYLLSLPQNYSTLILKWKIL